MKAVFAPLSPQRTALTLRLRMALSEQQRLERAGRIKTLREESPYTQAAIADYVGITPRAYQRWEEGGGIDWENLEKLAELHDVNVYWLNDGKERTETPDVLAALSPTTIDELREKLDQVLDQQVALFAAFDALRDDLADQRKPQAPDVRTPEASRD